jgi:citrate synthase
MSTALKSSGLEGISAGKTAICKVDQTSLIYRGYEIADLAENATFEEVAYLLLLGEKPTADELSAFSEELISLRELPEPVVDYLRAAVPMLKAHTAVPMDVLRTCVSILGNLHPRSQSTIHHDNIDKAKGLLAKIPTIIGHMQNLIDGRELVKPDASLGHAANLLYMMTGNKPSEEEARVIDVSLILYAEHDFNASTFTGRVISATLSDMHGAVTGAIAALKGPLHGGANEAAMEMLKEIDEHLNKGESVEEFMSRAFSQKRKLMGFGHRVYKNGDHRASILHGLGRKVAESKGDEAVRWFEIGEQVQRIMLEDKHIFPNVDFPCGLTYFVMGIPVPQYTPIFVAARVSGWAAHIIEQHENNRLIRPVAEYSGPDLRKWNAS